MLKVWNLVKSNPIKSAVTVTGLVGVGVIANNDGLKRSLKFWVGVLPVYGHYRYIQLRYGKSDIAEKNYQKLHERYAPFIEGLTLSLKGFYLKCAQIVSTQDGAVPDSYMKWMKNTQDKVPTEFADGQPERIIEAALGKPMNEIFSYFDKKPAGAASVGQVHYAILLDGTEVAVKIQFPNIERRFRSDIGTIKAFCKFAMPQHLSGINEIEAQFMSEFDFTKEAENLERVANNIMPHWNHKVVVPRPFMNLCRKQVLVMEYLHGVKLVDGIIESYKKYAEENGTTFEELQREQNERIKQGKFRSTFTEKVRIKLLQNWLLFYDSIVNTFKVCYNYSFGWVMNPLTYKWSHSPINLAEIMETLQHVHAHEIFIDGIYN
eukprot:TRINITY_DN1411_c0_g1_i1.p1 TRINITY_DN1411_c0_g1~~TRINITY_DN1411_c0_g1_i1.p1  ORF type:complete len:377 (-),score=48.89 TRINITY_DN1411_c0_g1_i1:578-1708(-)